MNLLSVLLVAALFLLGAFAPARAGTLVIFTSDNGGLSYDEDGAREKNTSNFPLRGRKGSEFDGGLRVPWIVRWPGQAPAGAECAVSVHHVDLYPTILASAGVNAPDQLLDGIDLLPVFKDPAAESKPRILFWYLPGYSAFHEPSVMARRGDWKMISRLDHDEVLLFHTGDEIGERTDRRAANAKIGESLHDAARNWLDDLDAAA